MIENKNHLLDIMLDVQEFLYTIYDESEIKDIINQFLNNDRLYNIRILNALITFVGYEDMHSIPNTCTSAIEYIKVSKKLFITKLEEYYKGTGCEHEVFGEFCKVINIKYYPPIDLKEVEYIIEAVNKMVC